MMTSDARCPRRSVARHHCLPYQPTPRGAYCVAVAGEESLRWAQAKAAELGVAGALTYVTLDDCVWVASAKSVELWTPDGRHFRMPSALLAALTMPEDAP